MAIKRAAGRRSLVVVTDFDGNYEVDLSIAEKDGLDDGPYRIEFAGWPAHLLRRTARTTPTSLRPASSGWDWTDNNNTNNAAGPELRMDSTETATA